MFEGGRVCSVLLSAYKLTRVKLKKKLNHYNGSGTVTFTTTKLQ